MITIQADKTRHDNGRARLRNAGTAQTLERCKDRPGKEAHHAGDQIDRPADRFAGVWVIWADD